MWRDLYPYSSHFLPREWAEGTARLHYLDEGQGSPVLLVHGNPTWSFYWRALVNDLRETHRIVVPDHIGCGLSDKPSRYPYQLDRHIDNLIALIESLDLREIVLGVHDWGGAIGLGAATRMPERFRKLLILNTGAFPPHFVPFRIRLCHLPVLGKIGVQGLNGFVRAALRMTTSRPEGLSVDVKAGLAAPYDSWSHRVGVYGFVSDIPYRKSHPTWRRLEQIERDMTRLCHLPARVVWGMDDWCFNESCLDKMSQLLPQAEVVRLSAVGHYVMEDAPHRVLEEMRQLLGSPSVDRELSGGGSATGNPLVAGGTDQDDP